MIGSLLCAVLIAPWPAAAGQADPATADLQAVAVNIHRTPVQSWPGYGIYLHDGLVVTAAHVAGHSEFTQPKVVVDGQEMPTEVIKEGAYPDNDLTVLKIDGPLPTQLVGRMTVLCAFDPSPGEAVVISTPEAISRSEIVSPQILPPDMRKSYAASIKDVYTTGNSGSGVFDDRQHCLLGIMSSKLEQKITQFVDGQTVVKTVGLAKHFVPAIDIQDFLVSIPHS